MNEYTLTMLDGSVHKIPASSHTGDPLADYVKSLEAAGFRDIFNVAFAEDSSGRAVVRHPSIAERDDAH